MKINKYYYSIKLKEKKEKICLIIIHIVEYIKFDKNN